MANKNNLKGRDYLILAAAVAMFVWYMYTARRILNYPEVLHYAGIGLCFIIALLVDIRGALGRWTALKLWQEKVFAIVLTVAGWVLIAVLAGTAILIPFNYYDMYVAADSPRDTVYCPINGVVSRTRNHNVYFIFKGKMNMLNCQTSLTNEIAQKKNYDDYTFIATVRKGLMDSYVLDDWQIAPVDK